MGFLDRMISDLIQDNTGFNARRLVRKIGGGKMLAMGGAALAAGMLAEKKGMLGQGGIGGMFGQGAGNSPQAAPPPVPSASTPPTAAPPASLPGAAPPPPLPGQQPAAPPPLPVSEPTPNEAAEPPVEVSYAIVRTMVAAALADGNLAPEEKAIITKHLGDSGFSDEQTQQIHRDLVLPPSPAELVELAQDTEARETLFRFGALVTLADQDVSDLERQWLNRLAAALELAPERKAALESEIFATDDDG